jgi:hypothetical protein
MSNKNIAFISLYMILLGAGLAACGAGSASIASATSLGVPAASGSAGNATLPLASQLLVGTFRLEGSPNAIDAATAVALLPLWQMERELATNDSAAQVEADTVTDLISATMTSTRREAIEQMNLTQSDLAALQEQLGLAENKSTISTPQAQPGGIGGPGDGGFPGGGETGGGPVMVSNASGSQVVNTLLTPSGTDLSTALLDKVITLLQQRAEGADTPNA